MTRIGDRQQTFKFFISKATFFSCISAIFRVQFAFRIRITCLLVRYVRFYAN